MHPDTNDSRLTAFALGELDDAERVELEQHLADCAACRQEVERLRELAGLLTKELASDMAVSCGPIAPIKLPRPWRRELIRNLRTARGLSLAAGILLVVGIGLYFRGGISRVENHRDVGMVSSGPDLQWYNPPAEQLEIETTVQMPEFKSEVAGRGAQSQPADSFRSLAPMAGGNESLPNAATLGLEPKLAGPATSDPSLQSAPLAASSGKPKQAKRSIFSTDRFGVAPPAGRLATENLGGMGGFDVKSIAPTTAASSYPASRGMGGGMGGMGPLPGATPSTRAFAFGGQQQGRRSLPSLQTPSYQPLPPPKPDREFNTEAYDRIVDNPFVDVQKNPLSTFSIDVDTASYSNVRRFLMEAGTLPPPDAVRIEELVNYFSYDYSAPKDDAPFAAHIEAADCPWAPKHRLVRIGLKGRTIADEDRPASNLVFLLDVSGSMQPENKLPLVIRSMSMLVRKLNDRDRVAIAVYAGASGLVLPSTSCENKETILAALERLEAGGSTNGGEGIQLAYNVAANHFIRGGTNRVILCTDGDFNVGVTNRGDLTRLIEKEAKRGTFLTVLGFGMGNLKDATLEQLADKGNGNYGYIDTPAEARKLFVEQLGGTLVTIAKDVKIQVEFNPAQAGSYRLIGYENRMLQKEDFNDDKKDAGEIGAGHTVTALYEVVPPGQSSGARSVDPLKYQQPPKPAGNANRELLTLKLRYKQPDAEKSRLIEKPFIDGGEKWAKSSRDFRFAAAVAAFGMILRDSQYKGNATLGGVKEWAVEGKGADESGYRTEFLKLIDRAEQLKK